MLPASFFSPGILLCAVFFSWPWFLQDSPVTVQCIICNELQCLCPCIGNDSLREAELIPESGFFVFFFFPDYICSLVNIIKITIVMMVLMTITSLPAKYTLLWIGQWFLRYFVAGLCFSWKLWDAVLMWKFHCMLLREKWVMAVTIKRAWKCVY